MDGWITIGTKLNTDKFDRQITDLDKKIKKEEDKKIIIESKLGKQQEELEQARQKTDELADAYQRLKTIQEQVTSGKATPTDFMAVQELEQEYGTLQKIEGSFDKALSKQEALEQKVAQTKAQFDGINQKVQDYKSKIEGIKLQKHQADISKIKNNFSEVGNSIQGVAKKIGKLTLGIFAVRSAVSLLRKASSDLANYDDEYASNLEYIRFVITQAIAPALKGIVQLVMTLLQYINMIAQGWFGVNLFANGSVKAFEKMKNKANGVGKAVKEIKNQLAGFDEMNVLTDTRETSSGGGFTMPSMDLSSMQAKPPEWLQWIIDNKDLILSVLAGITTALIGIKLFGLDPIMALGIGAIVGGVVYAIQGLIDYLKNPTFSNFGKIIQGIGIAIIGVGIAFAGLPAIIVGAIVLIVGTIIKHWEEIKAFFQKGIDWLKEKSDWVHQMFGDVIGNIYDTIVNMLQHTLTFFDDFFKAVKQIFDGIIQFIKGVFTGNWKEAWEGIKKIFSGVINAFTSTFNWFINILKEKVAFVGKTLGDIFGGAFKGVVNAVLRTIENIMNTPINAINRLIDVINAIPGIYLSPLRTFNLPRLAVGGIVNMPNKGTMVGGAIAGESGREGVLPLTDTNAMQILGQEIGKWITINANITNTMNGRVISRQLQQIQSDRDFAYNT